MPNTSSAKKELRKAEKRHAKNYRMKTHVRSLSKQLKEAVAAGKKEEAKDLSKKLQKFAAKSTKSNVFHKNKVNRIISKAAKSAQAK